MIILAIETSHDDTSVAILNNKNIVWEKTISQTSIHKKYGGTVPELASRNHLINLSSILKTLINKKLLEKIEYIAYTEKPGLIGSLHMGSLFAKALSLSLNVPIIGINHLHAHIFSVLFEHEIVFPAIALVVSGGHTQLWYVESFKKLKVIGSTRDDAAGEVLDKLARKLKIGFPGGPVIEKEARKNNKKIMNFPVPKVPKLDFSFSGIKSKLINFIDKNKDKKISEICYLIQENIFRHIEGQTKKALIKHKPNSLILSGGVAANKTLGKKISQLHKNTLIPSIQFATDNAKMIGITALKLLGEI